MDQTGKKYYKDDKNLKDYFETLPTELQENIMMTGAKPETTAAMQALKENKQK